MAERVLGGATGKAYAALTDAAALGLLPLVADGLEIVAALAADADRTVAAARLQDAAGRLRVELGMAASPLVRLLELDDTGRWSSLRTMDMDHEQINRFWSAVTVPHGVGAG